MHLQHIQKTFNLLFIHCVEGLEMERSSQYSQGIYNNVKIQGFS